MQKILKGIHTCEVYHFVCLEDFDKRSMLGNGDSIRFF